MSNRYNGTAGNNGGTKNIYAYGFRWNMEEACIGSAVPLFMELNYEAWTKKRISTSYQKSQR